MSIRRMADIFMLTVSFSFGCFVAWQNLSLLAVIVLLFIVLLGILLGLIIGEDTNG